MATLPPCSPAVAGLCKLNQPCGVQPAQAGGCTTRSPGQGPAGCSPVGHSRVPSVHTKALLARARCRQPHHPVFFPPRHAARQLLRLIAVKFNLQQSAGGEAGAELTRRANVASCLSPAARSQLRHNPLPGPPAPSTPKLCESEQSEGKHESKGSPPLPSTRAPQLIQHLPGPCRGTQEISGLLLSRSTSAAKGEL